MGKAFAVLAASAVLAFSGIVFAAEPFPEQEATVTTTVTDPEGKVLQEDKISDTTKGADTTLQYKELEKGATGQEMKTQEKKADEKAAAPVKKKSSKKKVKKSTKKTEPAPTVPTPPAAPESK